MLYLFYFIFACWHVPVAHFTRMEQEQAGVGPHHETFEQGQEEAEQEEVSVLSCLNKACC